MKLKGKVALVTGASRGIGRAIAISLAKEGAYVAVNYASNAKAAQEVVKIIQDAGSDAMAFQADIADISAVEKMVAEIMGKKGGHRHSGQQCRGLARRQASKGATR